MKVAVVGCGYVGLVTVVGLARLGHEVTAIEADEERLAALSRGRAPFTEPGVTDGIARGLRDRRIRIAAAVDAAGDAEVILLCIQTPPTASGGVELRYLEDAARALAAALREAPARRRVIGIRSTVPPGTNERISSLLGAVPDAAVVSNPEFLREGTALDDFLNADRIVIGAGETWAAETMRTLYGRVAAPVVVTTPATAELAKYASNALLATLVSFSNELAGICEGTDGVDVEDVLGIVHRDRRFSVANGDGAAAIVTYLKAGCGYGGSCLPKDVSALLDYARSLGEEARLLDAVTQVNGGQAARLVDLAERRLGRIEGRRIAVLGAAFKAGTDDIRESPALRVVAELVRRRAAVVVYDPLVERARLAAAAPAGVDVADTLDAALVHAEACLVTTHAPEFARLGELLAARNGDAPIVVDGRRGLAADAFPRDVYVALGRGSGG